MNKAFRFADIERASDCRRRLQSLGFLSKLDSSAWASMQLQEHGNYHGELDRYFMDPAKIMRAAIADEIAALKAELEKLGVVL